MVLLASGAFCSVMITVKIAQEVRSVERALDSRFTDIDRKLHEIDDQMWTIEMQAVRDSLVAKYNTNNWIPNPREIQSAIKLHRDPTTLRMMP